MDSTKNRQGHLYISDAGLVNATPLGLGINYLSTTRRARVRDCPDLGRMTIRSGIAPTFKWIGSGIAPTLNRV